MKEAGIVGKLRIFQIIKNSPRYGFALQDQVYLFRVKGGNYLGPIVKNNNVEIISWLLDNFQIMIPGIFTLAIAYQNKELALMLLQRGQSEDLGKPGTKQLSKIVDQEFFQTILEFFNYSDSDVYNLTIRAIKKEKWERVDYLLTNYDDKNYLSHIINTVIWYDNLPLIKKLAQSGKITPINTVCPLIACRAVKCDKFEILQWLVAQGCKLSTGTHDQAISSYPILGAYRDSIEQGSLDMFLWLWEHCASDREKMTEEHTTLIKQLAQEKLGLTL